MDEQTKATIQKVAELVTPAVTDAVIGKIKEDVTVKAAIHSGSEESDIIKQKTAFAEGLKNLEAKNVKGLSTAAGNEGLNLVPTYVSSEIERVASASGLVDKYARKWPMSGTKENVPTSSSLTVYRVDTDGTKIDSSVPTLGAVNLSSKTLGVIIPVSRKFLRNASNKTVDALLQLAAEGFATLRDQWAILGLASGEGVFQGATVPGYIMSSGKDTYAEAEPEDLLEVIDKVDENIGDEKLRWVMSRSVLNGFRKQRAVVGSDKQNFLFSGFGAQLPPTMWNIEYSLSPIMPKRADVSQASKKFVALMDFNKVILGSEVPYTFEISEQATITDTDGNTLINLFQQNMVALKVTCEQDIQLANPDKTFAWLKTAAS